MSSFDLHLLPKKALEIVYDRLTVHERIAFSLTSKQLRDALHGFKRKPFEIRIFLERTLQFMMTDRESNVVFDFLFNGASSLNLTRPISVIARFGNREQHDYTNQGMSIKDWMNHLHFVSNYSEVYGLHLSEAHIQYDLDSILNTFPKNVKILILCGTLRTGIDKVLETYKPKELLLPFSIFDVKPEAKRFLGEQYDRLLIENDTPVPKTIPLTLLLSIESSIIKFSWFAIIEKEFNRFLKLWKQGSCPRMECLTYARCFQPVDKDALLRGLQHRVVPDEHRRTFKTLTNIHGNTRSRTISGGIDITRKDGVVGTINFISPLSFEFLVWH